VHFGTAIGFETTDSGGTHTWTRNTFYYGRGVGSQTYSMYMGNYDPSTGMISDQIQLGYYYQNNNYPTRFNVSALSISQNVTFSIAEYNTFTHFFEAVE
ncbi:MAG: hypothetical protein IKN38_08625, partial [Clostridia bacterium]|nr:hypothetical protein [Clostridia bacterium]